MRNEDSRNGTTLVGPAFLSEELITKINDKIPQMTNNNICPLVTSIRTMIFVVIVCFNCISQTSNGIGTPALVLPEDGSTITQNPPPFVWHRVDGAAGYNLQVSDDTFGTLGSIIIDVSCHLDTTYLPSSALGGGSYYWRVQAMEGG